MFIIDSLRKAYLAISRFFTPYAVFIAASASIMLYTVILTTICVLKYIYFQYHDWDMAIYVNVLWSIVHGSAYSSILGQNFLLDHANIIAFLIALPYFVLRHPVFLLFLQSLALGISALPVFLVARDKLDDISALFLTLLYLLYPAIYYANMYEFNFEAFSLPFLSFAFYFLMKRRTIPFVAMCIGACSCKENIPLTVCALGVFAVLRPRRRLMGLIAIAIALAWFYFVASALPALLRNKSLADAVTFNTPSKYMFLLRQYGDNIPEVIGYFLAHPLAIINDMFSGPGKMVFLNNIFGILMYLPLLRPDLLIINIPHLMVRLLSQNPNEHTVYVHSAAALAPFVFFALIFTIKTYSKMIPRPVICRRLILVALIIFETCMGLKIWHARPNLVKFRLKPDTTHEAFIRAVPAKASAAASFEFLSHMANRDKIYSVHTLFGRKARKWNIEKDAPDYVLIDFDDRLLYGIAFESPSLLDKKLWSFLNDKGYALIRARGSMLLFGRGYRGGEKLIDISQSKDPASNPVSYLFKADNAITLIKNDMDFMKDGYGILRCTFYWYVSDDIKSDYILDFYINEQDVDKEVDYHQLGYELFPSSMWKSGQTIREDYWLILPKLARGKYRLSAKLIDIKKRKTVKIEALKPDDLDRKGRYIFTDLEEK